MFSLLLALSTGLAVETSTPDALCPPLPLVKSAVADRLGAIELSAPWTLHYESVHREAGDFVRLELRGPTGAVRLQREFAGYGESCATLAQVMAVVVERYFRSFQAEDSESDLPEPASATKSSAAQPQMAFHSAEIGAALTTQALVSPLVRSVWERPGAAGLLGFFSLDLRLEPFMRRESLAAGEAKLWSGSLGISVGARGNWGQRLRWRVGPVLLGRLEHTATSGLAVSSSGTRLVPAAGMGAALGTKLGAGFGVVVGASAVALARFATPAFRVDSREIFALPAVIVSGDVALQLFF